MKRTLKTLGITYGVFLGFGIVAWTALFVIPKPHSECGFNDSVGPCGTIDRFVEGIPIVTFMALYFMVPIVLWFGLMHFLVYVVNKKQKKKKVSKR